MATSNMSDVATNGNDSGVVMSKSKKKRMKQKASKEKKREAEQQQQQPNGEAPATLNPHEKLHYELTRAGYTSAEVESALEEMWNLGMEYDDIDSVRQYLEMKRSLPAPEPVAAEPVVVVTEEKLDGEIEDGGSPEVVEVVSVEATAEPSSTSTWTQPPVAEETTEAAPPSAFAPPQKPQPPQKPVVPVNPICLKLDMVANHENLEEAIATLAQWIKKAAKPDELNYLCTKTPDSPCAPALYTILVRLVQLDSDMEFERLTSRVLVNLTTALSSTSSLAVTDSLCDTLASIRSSQRRHGGGVLGDDGLPILDHAAMMSCAIERSCLFLQKLIRQTMPTSSPSTTSMGANQKHTMTAKLEAEIEMLMAQQAPRRGGSGSPSVMELMTRRDCRKQSVEKSAALLQLWSPTTSTITTAAVMSPQNGHSISASTVTTTTDILPVEARNALAQNRSMYVSMMERRTNLAAEQRVLATEMESIVSDLMRLEERKQSLQDELRRVMDEVKKITTRKERCQSRMGAGDDGLSFEEIERRKQVVAVEDEVSAITESLRRLEAAAVDDVMVASASVTDGVGSGASADGSEDLPDLTAKYESFLMYGKNYFATEVECVDFLRNRADKLQRQANELQREIAECAGLGMNTNLHEMRSTLKSLLNDVEEDHASIAALRAEAEGMKTLVVSMAQTYGNHSLLGEIAVLSSRMGVILDSFPSSSSSLKSRVVHTKTGDNVPPPKSQQRPQPTQRGWGTTGSIRGKGSTTGMRGMQSKKK